MPSVLKPSGNVLVRQPCCAAPQGRHSAGIDEWSNPTVKMCKLQQYGVDEVLIREDGDVQSVCGHAILILTPSCERDSGPARRLIEYGCDKRESRGPRASGSHIRMYRYTGLVTCFSNYNPWL